MSPSFPSFPSLLLIFLKFEINTFTPYSIKTIFDFMDAMGEDDTRNQLLKRLSINEQQLGQIAGFTNKKYPNIDLSYELEDEDSIVAGSPAYIKVKIEREVDDGDGDDNSGVDTTVHAPFYPHPKMENWWLVVGEESTKSLLAIKRATIGKRLNIKLEYTVPTPGKHQVKLFLMSDSYVGVDLEEEFEVEAAEGMDENEDEEEDD